MTKTCPFCAEEIQEAAIKCKHCGEMINAEIKPRSTSSSDVRISSLNFSSIIDFFGIIGFTIYLGAMFGGTMDKTGIVIIGIAAGTLIHIYRNKLLKNAIIKIIVLAFGYTFLIAFTYISIDEYFGKKRFDASMEQLRQEELLKLKEKELRLQEKELEERKKSREGSELGILTGIYCAVTRNC